MTLRRCRGDRRALPAVPADRRKPRLPEVSARASATRYGQVRAREIGLPAPGTVTWLPVSGHAGDGRRAQRRGRLGWRVL